ncbi:MAG: hypothetical protein AABX27_04550 [Nanoarchaeota archaeon]
MKMNKKGAIEMSMQTIIVVIIGVTLLTLGIKFVSDTMGKTTGLSDSMFESGDTLMNDIFGGSDAGLSIRPDMTTIRVGDTGSAKIYLRNTGSDDGNCGVELKVTEYSGTDQSAITSAGSWLKLKSPTNTIKAGAMLEKTLAIVPPKTAKPGTYTAEITSTGACEGSTGLIVIVKGSS